MLNAFHSEQTSAVPDGIRRAILAFLHHHTGP